MDDAQTSPEGPSHFDLAHQQATQTPLSEVTTFLKEVLSTRLTAYMCGVTDGRLVRQWVSGEVADMSHAIEQRPRAAYEIVLLLLQFDGPVTVRAWFIGTSPVLDDRSAAEAIREGRFDDAMAAAREFIAYG